MNAWINHSVKKVISHLMLRILKYEYDWYDCDDNYKDISEPSIYLLIGYYLFITIYLLLVNFRKILRYDDDDCKDISEPKLWNGVLEYLLVIGNPWQDGSPLII